MKNKRIKTFCAVLALMAVTGVGVYAATTYGTAEDPLITKSYLDETLTPQLMEDFDAQLQQAKDALESSTQSGAFTSLTLKSGQTLTCAAGSELLLRTGALTVAGTDKGLLVDTTAGATADGGGALTGNHLYLAAADCAVSPGAEGAEVLVSGTYSVK